MPSDRLPFRARFDVAYDGDFESGDDDFDLSEGDEDDAEDEDSVWAFESEFDVRVETLEHRGWR